jgi:hypothetical protein
VRERDRPDCLDIQGNPAVPSRTEGLWNRRGAAPASWGVHSNNRDQHRPPHQRPRCLTDLPGKTTAKKSGESSEQTRAAKCAKAVQISQTEALPQPIESLRRRTPSKFGPYVTRRPASRGRARDLADIGHKRVEVENPAYSDGVCYTS